MATTPCPVCGGPYAPTAPDADSLTRRLGLILRRRRTGLAMTLADLALRAGVSLGYLSQVELGKNKCSLDVLTRVCAALALDAGAVLSEALGARPEATAAKQSA